MKVETFEDALKLLDKNHPYVKDYLAVSSSNVSENILSYLKLRIIIYILNDGWFLKRPFSDFGYKPIFNSCNIFSFVESIAVSDDNFTIESNLSLVLKTCYLSDYCGKQFIDLWKSFYSIDEEIINRSAISIISSDIKSHNKFNYIRKGYSLYCKSCNTVCKILDIPDRIRHDTLITISNNSKCKARDLMPLPNFISNYSYKNFFESMCKNEHLDFVKKCKMFHCDEFDLHIGDKVFYISDINHINYIYGPYKILGFDNFNKGHFIYLDFESYWCPASLDEIIIYNE